MWGFGKHIWGGRKSEPKSMLDGLKPMPVIDRTKREASAAGVSEMDQHFANIRHTTRTHAATQIQGVARAYITEKRKQNAAAHKIQGMFRAKQKREHLETRAGHRALKRDAMSVDMVERGTSWRSGTFSGLKTSLGQNMRSMLWHAMPKDKREYKVFGQTVMTNSNFTQSAYHDVEASRTVARNKTLGASLERNKTINAAAQTHIENAESAELGATVAKGTASVAATAVGVASHGTAAPVAVGIKAAGGVVASGMMMHSSSERGHAASDFDATAHDKGKFESSSEGGAQRELTMARGRGEALASKEMQRAAYRTLGSTLLTAGASQIDPSGSLEKAAESGAQAAVTYGGDLVGDHLMGSRKAAKRQIRLNKRAQLDALRRDASLHKARQAAPSPHHRGSA